MKILALSYLFPNHRQPDYGIFVYNRLTAVSRYHNVNVVAPIPWFPFRHCFSRYQYLNDIPHHEKTEGMEIYRPRFFVIPRYLKWSDSIFYLLSTFRTILRLNRSNDFDIIDVHWVYPDILTGYFFAKKHKKPMVVTIRGKEAICYGEKNFRKNIIDCLLKKADRVVCLSEELADIVMNTGVSPGNIEIISNGVNVDHFKLMDQHECRQRLNLPLNKKIILSVGSLIKRKGFQDIIKALPDIVKKHSDIQLYIVGAAGPEGDFQSELIKLIKALSLQKYVVFAGQRPNNELLLWYNAADVFCLATRGEGSPNVVLEALACGCPVVASSVGGIPEIMCEEHLGFIFEIEDKDKLSDVLLSFFDRTWNRQKIRTYMTGFTWDWCAKNVINVYQKVAAKK